MSHSHRNPVGNELGKRSLTERKAKQLYVYALTRVTSQQNKKKIRTNLRTDINQRSLKF